MQHIQNILILSVFCLLASSKQTFRAPDISEAADPLEHE